MCSARDRQRRATHKVRKAKRQEKPVSKPVAFRRGPGFLITDPVFITVATAALRGLRLREEIPNGHR
jgi:hypothetical protein